MSTGQPCQLRQPVLIKYEGSTWTQQANLANYENLCWLSMKSLREHNRPTWPTMKTCTISFSPIASVLTQNLQVHFYIACCTSGNPCSSTDQSYFLWHQDQFDWSCEHFISIAPFADILDWMYKLTVDVFSLVYCYRFVNISVICDACVQDT